MPSAQIARAKQCQNRQRRKLTPYGIRPTIGEANNAFPVSAPTVAGLMSLVNETVVEWSQLFTAMQDVDHFFPTTWSLEHPRHRVRESALYPILR